ncbi:Splicing factor [Borealophlyctis nickersoniae]|nr:Splicing factor [Borealophlyctis nickersoniae]
MSDIEVEDLPAKRAMAESDSDPDSDMEDVEEDVEEAMEVEEVSAQQLAQLKEQVDANVYNYDAHVAYISALRRAADLEKLRAAREAMAGVFPLSEDLWMEWIQDEKEIAATANEKESILELFERATADYLSIKLWHAYVTWVTDEFSSALEEQEDPWLSLQRIREIGAAASRATGYHFAEVTCLLDFIRFLSENEVQRVRSLFVERLKVPHAVLDETFTNYSSFESKFDESNYENHLKAANSFVAKARKDRDGREPFERKLVESKQGYAEFLNYIAFEKKKKQNGHHWVRTLYERAIAVHCLIPALWDAFVADMMIAFPVPGVVLPLTERAVKNCFVSADLWSHRLRALSFFDKPEDQIANTYQRAMSFVSTSGDMEETVKLLQTHCELYTRRLQNEGKVKTKSMVSVHIVNPPMETDPPTQQTVDKIRSVYEEGIALLKKALPNGDPFARLERSLIRMEVQKFKDVARARSIYESVGRKSSQSDLYAEWAAFERTSGSVAKARSVYKQAVARRLDWPERLFEAWLAFEREEGNFTQYYEAYNSIKFQMKVVEERRAREAAAAEMLSAEGLTAAEGPKVEGSNQAKGKKRERPQGQHGEEAPDSKRLKGAETEDQPMEEDKATKPDLHQYHTIDSASAGNMLYITNLSPRVDEPTLRKVFGQFGKIVDLVLQPNEISGQLEAYIEYLKPDQVRRAVTKNGTEIEGTAVSVVRCRPSKAVWDFSVDRKEDTKIYVRNLSVNIEKIALRKAFSQFGKIKDIRLSHRKTIAFAYIEFQDAESAQRSLKLDETELEPGTGRKIGVAISDPTKRAAKQVDEKEVYVTNLAPSLTEEDIETTFGKFGKVKHVHLLKNPRNERASAFVEFEEESAAKAALSLNATMLDGHYIAVTVPDPNARTRRTDQARGRGRGGSGRGQSRGGGPGRGKPGLGYRSNGQSGGHTREEGKETKSHNAGTAAATPVTAFVPRSALKPPTGRAPHRKQVLQIAKPVQAGSAGPSDSGTTAPKSMKSQDDFRKMLAGGK